MEISWCLSALYGPDIVSVNGEQSKVLPLHVNMILIHAYIVRCSRMINQFQAKCKYCQWSCMNWKSWEMMQKKCSIVYGKRPTLDKLLAFFDKHTVFISNNRPSLPIFTTSVSTIIRNSMCKYYLCEFLSS